MMGVTAYRQLLRTSKMRTAGAPAPEESAVALQHARERIMLRLSTQAERVQRDPRRAFARLRDQVARLRDAKDSAKDSIREMGSVRAARLRSAYHSLRQRGLQAVGSRTALPEAEVLGHDGLLRVMVLGSVAAASKLFMQGLSRTTVEGRAALAAAQARPAGQPLITVSNHVAAMDDPLLLAALTPFRSVFEKGGMRWSLCATDRCFKNGLMSAFFRAGQTLPVERGKGMDQAGMRAAEQRLAAGDWVHIFPEGTRSPDGRSLGQLRSGVGRLVAACEAAPVVLPIVHTGMERVMPRGSSFPVPGQEVRVLVGDPVPVADLLRRAALEQWPDARLYRSITARIADSLSALKAQLDGAPLPAAPAAAVLDEAHLLPMIEDELDADTHSWLPSLRQAAGLPSLVAQAQAAVSASRLHSAAAASSLPVSGGGLMPAASLLRSHYQTTGSPILQHAASSAAEYAQERMRHMMAMFATPQNSLQPAL